MLRRLLLAVLLVLTAPGVAAAAGTVSKSGSVITFEGDPSSEVVSVSQGGGNVTFAGATASATCPGATPACLAAGTTLIVMRGNAGNDVLVLDGSVTIAAQLDGGAGSDVLRGGTGADTLATRDGAADGAACGGGADTVVADSIDSVSGCEALDVSSALERDADHDGWGKPADCDDGNPAIHPTAVDVPQNGVDENCTSGDELFADRDGDGTPSPLDCDDDDPKMRPGNKEIPGNDKDDDCDGRSFPLPLLQSTVSNRWRLSGQDLIGIRFVVSDVPKGTVVELKCNGSPCPFKRIRKTIKKHTKRLSLNRYVAGKRFPKGRRIELILTNRRYYGRQIRYDVTGAAVPRVESLCRRFGGRPTNC